MNKRDYGFKEQDIINNFKASLNDVSEKAGPEFKNAIPSAIDHSVNLLKTDNLPTFDELGNIRSGVINQFDNQDTSDNNYGQGQSNTKEKVRVRTIGGPSSFGVQSSSASSESDNNQYSNMGSDYSNENAQNVWRTGGYTETMILIGTGVLVLLVFMISYLILNYFG